MPHKSTIDRESILHFLRTKSSRPLSLREIARSLGIHKTEMRPLKRIVRSLTAAGDIYKTRAGTYGPAEKMNLQTGLFEAHRDGYGFVVPEKSGEQDIFIPPRRTMGAMSGDRVVARMERPAKREGSIIRILERGTTKVIGEFCKEKNVFYVRPKGKKVPFPIVVAPHERGKAGIGDTVAVEIITFPTASTPPAGRVVKVIPPISEPRHEAELIIEEYSLSRRFPPAVMADAKSLKEGKKSRGRIDCRELLTVTIDGETAKDFDDAVSVAREKTGYVLYVHIADVSHYIPWDSPLDLEARRRGTSVYFPGSVIPMLPERLSNDLCSLVPRQERLTFTVEMHFDRHGELTDRRFYPSIIFSDERMTYTAVKKILFDRDPEERARYDRLIESFEVMEELAAAIRKKRVRRGSLDFDLPEPEILLDIQGNPEAIIRAERNLAHMMIEDFMIAANEAVASFLEQQNIPALYRIHEKPDPVKIEELKPVFRSFGINVKGTGPKIFHSILRQAKGSAEESLLNILLLRSLKQAKYFTENMGHFGLASPCYTHFTSPIRRYPDLVVHRILKSTLNKGGLSQKSAHFLEKTLPDIAVHSSKTERTADEAEREIVNALRVWFMKDKLGNEYQGIVTNVTSQGLKIQLRDFFIEGFLHVSSMADDYYRFDEGKYRLVGRQKKKAFRVGQELTVRVERVDPGERSILLGLV